MQKMCTVNYEYSILYLYILNVLTLGLEDCRETIQDRKLEGFDDKLSSLNKN